MGRGRTPPVWLPAGPFERRGANGARIGWRIVTFGPGCSFSVIQGIVATPIVVCMDTSPTVLKERAAALELRKQPEKALALYRRLLADYSGTEHVDVTVRNRVGDLCLRLQQTAEAVALFEMSTEEYANGGYLSNAIALCNKILRLMPDHVPTLRRLARFSAAKGMVMDAQRNYLTVVDALEKRGEHAEALTALNEFVGLAPDDAHVRSVVVAQLISSGRTWDALPHLTVLHRLHLAAARHDDAAGAARAALDIDANWVPDAEAQPEEKQSDLPFLMLDGDGDSGRFDPSTVMNLDVIHTPERARRWPSGDRRCGTDRRKVPRSSDVRHDSRNDVVL
jgi:tetratricopeptide (TPR) repeat protein